MSKNKWLKLILSASLLLNIWLGLQYKSFQQLSDQNNQAAVYIANMTLANITKIISLTSQANVDWESVAFNIRLENELENLEKSAYMVSSLNSLEDENLEQIRQELVSFAMTIRNVSWQVKSLGKETALTKKDVEELQRLTNNLKRAGFNRQVQEDNGEDFKNSLKRFSTSDNIILIEKEVRTVIKEQLNQVSQDMTYSEVVRILGNSKNIGSGLNLIKYKYTNGQELILNFGNYSELISNDDYKEIQNLRRN